MGRASGRAAFLPNPDLVSAGLRPLGTSPFNPWAPLPDCRHEAMLFPSVAHGAAARTAIRVRSLYVDAQHPKELGRVEHRRLWTLAVDGATVGLAGAAQIFRIDQKIDYLRRGKVIKSTSDTRYGVTSLLPEEAEPEALLALVRGYWAIEIKQHYRRDHTQREDHCQVRHTVAARNLSLMRSLAIFLFELQRGRRKGKRSLPDWLRNNHRHPKALISLLTPGVP